MWHQKIYIIYKKITKMKKIILRILVTLMIVSWFVLLAVLMGESNHGTNAETRFLQQGKTTDDNTYTMRAEPKTYIIDSCEYIGYMYMGNYTLTHKGNCRFCAERRKKESHE